MALGKRLISTGVADAACTTDSTDPFGDSSGVALYSLDYDASTAPDGTDYSGIPTDVEFGVGGQINYGARFNGSSSYIAANGIFSSSPSVISASVWFKTTSDGNILDIGDNSVSTAQNRIFFSGGLLYVSLNGGGGGFASTSATGLQDGNWHHIVAVWDDGTVTNGIKMYIDGATTPTAQSNSTQNFVSALDLFIGANDNRGASSTPAIRQYLNGDIDQVRVFNKELNSTEVSTLYAETACVHTSTTDVVGFPTSASDDIIGYYKLDNSSEDFKGSNDGTDTNVQYRFGRFGQAAVFNGSSSIIQSPIDLDNYDETWSISMWINFDFNSSYRGIAGTVNSSAQNGFVIDIGTSGEIRFRLRSGSTSVSALNSSSTYGDGNWHHIVAVKGATTNYLYIDGDTEVLSVATTTGIAHNSQITFGRNGSHTDYFNGSIDQVRIFSTALTSDQVSQLYNEKPETDTSNFKTVLYEGTGATQYISNVGFQPDLVWIKNRDDSTASHALIDSVRGLSSSGTGYLRSDTTDEENITTNMPSSLDSNGFTAEGNQRFTNVSGDSYVAWCWVGGDAVNIAVNSITASTPSIASDVSANTDAGFSIVKYTGDGGTATLGHGLSQQVEMVITKSTESTSQWMIYHKDLTGNTSGDNPYNLYFTTNNELDLTAFGTYDSFTDSVFPVSRQSVSTAHNNNLNIDYIAYCFHSVAGYSKIGSYTGSGSSGKLVYTDSNGDGTGTGGFEPSFVMLKRSDNTGNWFIYDNKRGNTNYLRPDLSNQEGTDGNVVFNSGGFSINVTYTDHNQLNGTYIYMAFK